MNRLIDLQVPILHHMLSKSQVKARPSVLWCFKKDLGFSSHRQKKMKHMQKKIKQVLNSVFDFLQSLLKVVSFE